MGKIVAGITTSVDGYITGPDDGPGCGLGVGGERLHYWADSLAEAIERARAAAGDKQVHLMGGADIIRQALAAGYVDELTVIVAPVVLGAGKRLFDGFTQPLDLEHRGVRQSRYATFIDYRIVKQTP